MQMLQDALDSVMGEVPGLVLEKLLREKLSEQGVEPSDRDINRLRDAILGGHNDGLSLKSWRPWTREHVSLEITGDEINAAIEPLLSGLSNLGEDVSASVAANILDSLDRSWLKQKLSEDRQRRGFERRLRQRWRPAFEALQMMLVIAHEYGDGMNNDVRKMDILTRLHARGLQIANEILVLMKSGLADGAMARWRSFHEVAATALFMSSGDDVLAERYALHQVIESRRA